MDSSDDYYESSESEIYMDESDSDDYDSTIYLYPSPKKMDVNKKRKRGSSSKSKPKRKNKSKSGARKPKPKPKPKSKLKPPKKKAKLLPSSNGNSSISDEYQAKTHREHVLHRPDSYVGSIETEQKQMWIWPEGEGRPIYRSIAYTPALYKIFDEILVNAGDNKVRDPGMDRLDVHIDAAKGKISVFNNGKGIPVQIHPDWKKYMKDSKWEVYVPEFIFGYLLTSSNYDDSVKKITGGRNGYGAKLANIFSKEFIVEAADSKAKKKFKQKFTNNMNQRSKPSITSYKDKSGKGDWTRITFYPDFSKFEGCKGLNDDMLALIKKRLHDMAGCHNSLKVTLNGKRIKPSGFEKYVKAYLQLDDENEGRTRYAKHSYMQAGERWEVCIASTRETADGMEQVSLVNGICTQRGGTHVNYIADKVAKAVIAVIKKRKKGRPEKLPSVGQVKQYLWIFVNAFIDNPSFDSQTKDTLTTQSSKFGSLPQFSSEKLEKVVKQTGIVDRVLSWSRFQESQVLAKSLNSNSSRRVAIPKLNDANYAGKLPNSKDCTLILTEGDSAKALAVAGIGAIKNGRDFYGVFPLRGKFLNVRDASNSQIMANTEVNAIVKALGLKFGTNYEDTQRLRYGHLMVMTDQDPDGSHIKGLIINFIHHFWPSLLKIPGFMREFITPIVKAKKGGQIETFFTLPEYENWKRLCTERGWTIKYYKGLGTSTREEAHTYFRNIDNHRKDFSYEGSRDDDRIDLAFNKKRANDRKLWLAGIGDDTYLNHGGRSVIPYNEFIDRELVLFSREDCIRSIPNIFDGLKPGQRKILYTCLTRNLTKDIKVAQLIGSVSELTAYHHGEVSLGNAIVGMAATYTGKNNINLLFPSGQFGTRCEGGKDAASARYIFTRLMPVTRTIFHSDDDAILSYLDDDGKSIEPNHYLPILPFVLVNGAEGIGTGWRTEIPCYYPMDLVNALYAILDGKSPESLVPWYRGFNGCIEFNGNGKYVTLGRYKWLKEGKQLQITELPIGIWTNSYKEFLESMWNASAEKRYIDRIHEQGSDVKIVFNITLTKLGAQKVKECGVEKLFKLKKEHSLNMMYLFDENNQIRHFESADAILKHFVNIRQPYYAKRKEHLLSILKSDLCCLENKVRFIDSICKGELVVSNRKKVELIVELQTKNYSLLDNSYDYLLSMKIWTLTAEKLSKLRDEYERKREDVQELEKLSAVDLWKADLNAFTRAYMKFI